MQTEAGDLWAHHDGYGQSEYAGIPIRAQILFPSTSTCTAAGGPISLTDVGLGLGSFAHSPPGILGPPPFASPFTGRYGFARPDCAAGRTTAVRRTTKAQAAVKTTRLGSA